MAACNTAIQHANVAADANNSVLVTSKPNFSKPEAHLSPKPSPNLVSPQAASSTSSTKGKRRNPFSNFVQEKISPCNLTTRLEQLYEFKFELPQDYVPEMNDEITKLVSLGHTYWLPLAERLTGWTKEVRVRINGREIRDNFYYHGNKKFRTYKATKRYIYLGYPPSEENADGPLERWALDQPDPMLVQTCGPRASAALNINS